MFPHFQLVQYCERAGAKALTAEPLNAASNLGFFAVAAVAAVRLHRAGATGIADWSLTALAALIGAGSLLFHTLATPVAMAADVIPIAVFVMGYAVIALRRFLAFGWSAVAASLCAVAMLQLALSFVRCGGGPCLEGSLPYLPALALLALSAAATRQAAPAIARRLLAASVIFAVSLVLRSLDRALCDTLVLFGKPRGTHALWHLLNAVTLALLLDALMISAGANSAIAPGRAAPHNRSPSGHADVVER